MSKSDSHTSFTNINFFILCLANSDIRLALNLIGEFLSLYNIFQRLPILAALASFSIVFFAVYTIYIFNKICLAEYYSQFFNYKIPNLNKQEFYTSFTVILSIYISFIYL